MPAANIVLGGTGASRTVTVTPAPNQSGTATITLTVTDGNGGTASDTFVLTVTAVNDPPTISDTTDQTTTEDTATAALSVTVGDVETPAGTLTVAGELLEHDAGADRQHRGRRDGREPHGDDHAGAESVRHRDDHADGDRRGWRDGERHLPADRDGGQRRADDLRYDGPDDERGHGDGSAQRSPSATSKPQPAP